MKTPKDIIKEWEEDHLLDAEQPIFFTVRFRTLLTDWQNFMSYNKDEIWSRRRPVGQRLYFNLLEKAEELARTQSISYINSLTCVYLGDSNIMLSLWENGECIYKSESCAVFEGKDYTEMWE